MGAKAWLDDNDNHSKHVDKLTDTCCQGQGDSGDCECRDAYPLDDPKNPGWWESAADLWDSRER